MCTDHRFTDFLKQTQKEWQIVFIVAAGIYFIGAVVFAIFGNSNLQTWAVVNTTRNKKYYNQDNTY